MKHSRRHIIYEITMSDMVKIQNSNPFSVPQIPSGSEFLLNSTGSFKRFDSVDRDYKQVGQTSLSSPSLNANGPNIPPQPLRPAPAPLASPNDRKKAFERPVKQQRYEINMSNQRDIP